MNPSLPSFSSSILPSRKAWARLAAILFLSWVAVGAASAALYVDDTLQVTDDTGAPGLSAGDTVTFASGEAGQTAGLTFGTDAFSDIASAIAAASSGETIFVARGNYVLGSAIVVNKPITLLGAQAGVDPRPSMGTTRVVGSSDESIVDANNQSFVFNVTASQVTIDGFDLKNAASSVIDAAGSVALSSVSIRNNFIHNSNTAGGANGIRLLAVDNALIERNRVFVVANSGVQLGTTAAGAPTNAIVRFNEIHDLGSGGTTTSAIYVFASVGSTLSTVPVLNALIKGNLIYNHFGNDAIKLGSTNAAAPDRNVSGGVIEDNIVHDLAQDGITINTSNTTVQRNEVYHSFSSNGAIYVEQGGSGVSIRNNYVHDNSAGLAAVLIGLSGRPASPTGMVVQLNRIESNTNNFVFFRDNTAGTATCDASANWFGSANQASVAASVKSTAGSTSTTNRVDFTPWLGSGTDADPATPGFQPELITLVAAPLTVCLQSGGGGRIEEGSALAAIGGTVNVIGGPYTENLNVNRAVTVNLPATASVTGNISLSNGGRLIGSGTVNGTVGVADAILAPGTNGPAVLPVSSATLLASSTFAVDLNGTTAGTGYDQLSATGSVTLGGATLSLSASVPPALDSTFNIVHAGSLTGTFNGLPEGGILLAGPSAFAVHYSATDVTLTAVSYNLRPTIDTISGVTLYKGDGQQNVSLTGISAGPGESQNLTVTAVSSNPGLIPNPTVTYQSPDATGSLSCTPTPGATGSADITVTVTDDGGTPNGSINTKSVTFTVDVLFRNFAPTINTVSSPTVSKNDGEQTIALSGISAGSGESQAIAISASSSDPTLIPNPTIVYQSPNAGGTLKYTPQIGKTGTAQITVTVMDDAGTANSGTDTTTTQFTITVLARNFAPTFTLGADQSTAQDAGAQTVANWATAINPGSPDETAQALNFIVETDKSELFTVAPAISSTGTLTYTPVATASGTATITVRLHDDGGTANNGADTSPARTFTITITTYDEEKGTYNGLVKADAGVLPSHANSGLIRVVHGKKGALTGSLKLGGKTFAFKGTLDKGGVAHFGKASAATTTLALKRTGLPSLLLALQLDVGGGSDQLTGALKEDGTAFAVFTADRALYTAKKNPVLPLLSVPSELLGKYTVVFAAKSLADQGRAATEYPQGDGIGLLTVSTAGTVKLTGTLADGTAVSASNTLSKNQEWPFYAVLAKGKGSISGLVTFRETLDFNHLGPADLDAADLHWFKPAGALTAKFYPAGWLTGITTDLLGSKLVLPPAKDKISVFPDLPLEAPGGNCDVTFADGNLISALPKSVNISGTNKVTVINPADDKLALAIRATAGAVTGTFIHPVSGKKVTARGAVFQKQKRSYGFFLGASESGSFSIGRKF